MRNYLFAGAFLAAVAVFLAVVAATNNESAELGGDVANDGPTRALDAFPVRLTPEEATAKSDAVARIRVLRDSEQRYGNPPAWEQTSDPTGVPYVAMEVEVVEALKGDALPREMTLVDIGGPDVAVNGRVGASTGLEPGKEAVAFLQCGTAKPEGSCWVLQAYLLDASIATNPNWTDQQLPVSDLLSQIRAVAQASQ